MKNEQAHLEINLKAAEFQLCTLQCLGDCFMIMTCKINQSVQKSLQKCLDLRHLEDGPYRYQPDQWITKQFWTVYCHLSVRTWFGFILALASIRTKSSETFMSFRFKKKKMLHCPKKCIFADDSTRQHSLKNSVAEPGHFGRSRCEGPAPPYCISNRRNSELVPKLI